MNGSLYFRVRYWNLSHHIAKKQSTNYWNVRKSAWMIWYYIHFIKKRTWLQFAEWTAGRQLMRRIIWDWSLDKWEVWFYVRVRRILFCFNIICEKYMVGSIKRMIMCWLKDIKQENVFWKISHGKIILQYKKALKSWENSQNRRSRVNNLENKN